MADIDEKLPMDSMDDGAPPSGGDQQDTQEQRDQRARDEAGRFTKQDGAARGEPSEEHATRRYAQERDAARAEAQAAKAAHEALQKRLDDMSALARGDDPNATKEPVDPLKPVIERLDKFDQRFTEQDQARQAEETHRQVMTYSDQDEQRFRQSTPDFPEAISHYITSRLTEMQALGVDQAQAEAIFEQEARQLLYQSAQTGRSAAETIYTMAKARGYQPAINIEQPRQQQPAPQNFGGRSMGTGGGPAGGGVTAAQIAAMSEDDYMAFRATPEGKRAIQRAMSG